MKIIGVAYGDKPHSFLKTKCETKFCHHCGGWCVVLGTGDINLLCPVCLGTGSVQVTLPAVEGMAFAE